MLSNLEDLPSIQIGDGILKFELSPVTEFGREVAQKELRETNEVKNKAIEDLKELLRGKLTKLERRKKNTCLKCPKERRNLFLKS